MLDGTSMIMRFKNVEGRQVVFHRAMWYLYRPIEMKGMCLYEFFQLVDVVSESRSDGQETFQLLDSFPCGSSDVAVYRKRPSVPVFSWKWLGNTSAFATSIREAVDTNDPDYAAKEIYAKKFMILFMPFDFYRDDLKVDGSYQAALQMALAEGRINEEMIDVANNIMILRFF